MVRALLIIREYWVKVCLRLQKITGFRLGLEERSMFVALVPSIFLAKCPIPLCVMYIFFVWSPIVIEDIEVLLFVADVNDLY